MGSQHLRHRDLGQAIGDAARVGLSFGQSDARQLGIDEQTERHLTARGHSVPAGQILTHDLEIVFRNVREIGPAGAVTDGQHILDGRLAPLIHFDMTV